MPENRDRFATRHAVYTSQSTESAGRRRFGPRGRGANVTACTDSKAASAHTIARQLGFRRLPRPPTRQGPEDRPIIRTPDAVAYSARSANRLPGGRPIEQKPWSQYDDPNVGSGDRFIRGRRRRGTVTTFPTIYGRVSPEAKQVLERAARALGIAEARVMDAILLGLEVDENGAPVLRTAFAAPPAWTEEFGQGPNPESVPARLDGQSSPRGYRDIVSARVPADLAAAARRYTAEHGVTMSDYIMGLITSGLAYPNTGPTRSDS